MAILTVQEETATITFQAAAAGGDEFVNDGRTRVWMKEAAAEAPVALAVMRRKCNAGVLHTTLQPATGQETTALANDLKLTPAFDRHLYNDANGRAKITYTGTITNLTVAAVRMPPA